MQESTFIGGLPPSDGQRWPVTPYPIRTAAVFVTVVDLLRSDTSAVTYSLLLPYESVLERSVVAPRPELIFEPKVGSFMESSIPSPTRLNVAEHYGIYFRRWARFSLYEGLLDSRRQSTQCPIRFVPRDPLQKTTNQRAHPK